MEPEGSLPHSQEPATCPLRRNCLLKHVIEGNIEGRIEVTGRRGRRRKQLLDLKEKRGSWILKEEALDRTYGELALEEAMDLYKF
jgi:hypothetical protein